ncbi:MAG: hypothetical protein E7480_04685 [Ruminococcaceae bacterium]|nr:hypothetical protein [Oscillospiraceae bacterium]
MKRIVAVLITAITVFCCGFCVCAEAQPQETQVIAQNSKLILNANLSNGDFFVTEKASGDIYCSQPFLEKPDDNAVGMERTNMMSQITVEYIDAKKNTFVKNSKVAVINKSSLSGTKNGNGVRFEYNFKEENFVIPVEITLEEDRLCVDIIASEIKETGENKIISISLLPYFGATYADEKGYLLVPDGSGAIAEFNSMTSYKFGYSKEVYGEDPILYKKFKDTVEEKVYMPIFAIKREKSAMFAIVEDGAAVCTINADLAGIKTSYNSAGVTFNYRALDTTHLAEMSNEDRVLYVVPKKPYSKEKFRVGYYFLEGENADYSGMAELYRNYLIDKYNLSDKKSQGIALNLSYLASAEIKKSFLGIPYTGQVTLTTLDDVSKALEKFEQNGNGSVSVSMLGAFKGGLYGKIPTNLSINKKIGNVKKINTLIEKNKNIYLLADIQKVYKGGNGISSITGVSRSVSGARAEQFSYYLNTFDKNHSFKKWYLISALNLEKISDTIAKSVNKINGAFGIYNSGANLYSDYDKNNIFDRQAMLDITQTAFEKISNASEGIYFKDAFIYSLSTANMISSVPMKSSQYDMLTKDIPFYQMVIHGICDYASNSVNLEGDTELAILKSIEYGAAPDFSLIVRNTDIIHKTSEKGYYSCNSAVWEERIHTLYNSTRSFYKAVAGQYMTAHRELEKDVFETVYQNGYSVIVNYSDKDISVNGNTVKAESYCFLKGGVAYEN